VGSGDGDLQFHSLMLGDQKTISRQPVCYVILAVTDHADIRKTDLVHWDVARCGLRKW